MQLVVPPNPRCPHCGDILMRKMGYSIKKPIHYEVEVSGCPQCSYSVLQVAWEGDKQPSCIRSMTGLGKKQKGDISKRCPQTGE